MHSFVTEKTSLSTTERLPAAVFWLLLFASPEARSTKHPTCRCLFCPVLYVSFKSSAYNPIRGSSGRLLLHGYSSRVCPIGSHSLWETGHTGSNVGQPRRHTRSVQPASPRSCQQLTHGRAHRNPSPPPPLPKCRPALFPFPSPLANYSLAPRTSPHLPPTPRGP